MIAILLALLAVVNTPNASVSYACNGVTATYAVTFPYIAYTDLVVTSTTAAGSVTTLAYTTDYTVNYASTSTTATLTLNSPATKCPTGSALLISRTVSLTQPYSFKAQISYNQTLHETAYDRQMMAIQQLSAKEISDLSVVNNTVANLIGSGTLVNSTSNVTATGSSTPRTLAAWLADTTNVKACGAKGDGSTDDASAIQACDALSARLFFPPGTYIVGTTLVPANGHTWFGSGATLKKKATTGSSRIILLTGASSVTLDGLGFDGNRGNVTSVIWQGLVEANQSSSVTIRNCVFTNHDRFFVYMTDFSDIVLDGNSFDGAEGSNTVPSAAILLFLNGGQTGKRVRVTNNTVTRSLTPWYPAIQVHADGVNNGKAFAQAVVANNIVTNPFSSGQVNAIGIEIFGGVVDFSVVGNSIRGGAMGISISGSDYGTVTGNDIELGDAASTAALGLNHQGIEVVGNTRVTVSGNSIKGRTFLPMGTRVTNNTEVSINANSFAEFGTFTNARAIEMGTNTRIGVTNNQINCNGQVEGIYSGDSTEVLVTGNTIMDAVNWGIRLFSQTGTAVNGTVVGNMVRGSTATSGIRIDGYTNAVVTGNTLNITGVNGVEVISNFGSTDRVTVCDNVYAIGGGGAKILMAAAATYGTNMVLEEPGNAAPTGGYHTVGFKIINTNLSTTGGPSGWQCVAAGTPGTFVAIGPLGINQATLAAGTQTATVASGCRALCTNTSNANAIKCSVSGTTLTFTGTGTDVINYSCF